MLIKRPVGVDCPNHWIDVLEIQHLLNDNVHLVQCPDYLELDGKCDAETVTAIMVYQQQVMHVRQPDGKISPTGETLKSLLRTATSHPGSVKLCREVASRDNLFPLFFEPEKSYKSGMRKFGALRSKGKRLHAGCDLYAPRGTKVRAMYDGTVMRPVEYFYLGTYVLAINHGNFIARYGEISHAAKGIVNGSKVRRGDVIGYIGEMKFKSGNVMSMLHLEMYSGADSGPLTTTGNLYRRRGDLFDPTSVLDAATRTFFSPL